jgi:hypothetical protein
MGVTTEVVSENLKKIFGTQIALKAPFALWCQLGAFLSTKESVLSAMQELDSLMIAKFCDRNFGNQNRRATLHFLVHGNRGHLKVAYQKHFADDRSLRLPANPFSHLLSDVLTETEAGHSFTTEPGESQKQNPDYFGPPPQDPRERVPTYHGFVEPTDFMRQITKRSLWKDLGAQEVHGEFSHRLQWFAVMSRLFQNGATASVVFASIGEYEGTYKSETDERLLYLWDALCDRTNNKDVSFDDKLF